MILNIASRWRWWSVSRSDRYTPDETGCVASWVDRIGENDAVTCLVMTLRDIWQGQGFLFATTSIQALKPTQFVPRLISPGTKEPYDLHSPTVEK